MKILIIYFVNLTEIFSFIFSKHKNIFCLMNWKYIVK